MKILFNKSVILKSFALSTFLILSSCSAGLSSISYYILEIPSVPSEGMGNIQNMQGSQNAQEEYQDEQIKENTIQADINLDGPLISVLPIAIPRYLDRPQIVTRDGDYGIIIDESTRWGEILPLGIARVLSNSLTKNLSEIKTFAMPLRIGIVPDYTIQAEIINLEGSLQGEVKLRALWVLQKNEQKIWQSTYEDSAFADDTYSSYVQAYTHLINSLGKEMASVFLRIYEEDNKRR